MATLDERLARVKALASKRLTEFDHKTPGTVAVGEVVDLGQGESEWGPFPIVTLDTGEHLVQVPAARSNLRKQILGVDLRLGDALSIEYVGERPMANGKTYNAYRVHHEPAEPASEPPRIPTFEEPDADDDGSF